MPAIYLPQPPPSQQAAVVQWAQKDPAPGNLDDYFNGASTGGSPQFGLSQAGYLGSNTTNGNTLLCIAVIATDSHSTPPAGNQIASVQDTVNGAWSLAGTLDNFTDCNCQIKAYVKFNAQPLLTTSWTGTGSNNGAGVLTIGSGSGTFRLGQKISSASTPATSFATPPSFPSGETIAVSLASGTLGAAGSTYNLNRTDGAFASEAMTTRDIISQTFSQIFSFTDYPGLFLAELSGTDGSTTYFSGNNDAVSAGTDNVSSGNLVMAASPGILFGFSFNGGVDGSNASPVNPAAGTGFLTSQGILNYDQLTWTGAIATVEWQHFPSLGTRAAKFSQRTSTSRCATVGVGLLDHP